MESRKRKHGIFAVPEDTQGALAYINDKKRDAMTVEDALIQVFQQMRVGGNRERTIESYKYIFEQFIQVTQIKYVEDITLSTIYNYLDKLDVAKETKLIRLKSLKAILSRFFNNGWIEQKFWVSIQIKIDKKVKQGATEDDVEKLLQLIDTSTFTGLRDVVAILTMYKTGVRIRTIGELKEEFIDFENLYLNIDGVAMKNHKHLKLPIDNELANLYKTLIQMNSGIRTYYGTENTNLFITQNGCTMNNTKSSNNAISKQLNKYSKKFGLNNINAHALRRSYAKNLLKRGASVPLISKALGHSDIAVTTQYLDLTVDEVATDLKKYFK